MDAKTIERIEMEVADDIDVEIEIGVDLLTAACPARDEVLARIQGEQMDEEEARKAFSDYMWSVAEKQEWYATQVGEEDDTSDGEWDYELACKEAVKTVIRLRNEGKDGRAVILSTWINNYSDPYCTNIYRIGDEVYKLMGWEYNAPRHWYGMRLRPFGLGCQPKGFTDWKDADKWKDGYWSYVCYDRPLTEAEMENYDLDEIQEGEMK